MGTRQKDERSGGDGGKTEWKLSEAVSRGKNELIGKFRKAACDVISIN